MQRIDEAYILKMAGFEIDCNDGKGEPSACHHAGEFYATVNGEHERAAEIYKNNCENNKYGPSCFNLGRYHCKLIKLYVIVNVFTTLLLSFSIRTRGRAE